MLRYLSVFLEPSMRTLYDCDPGWTKVFRNTTQQHYCVRHITALTDAAMAFTKCEQFGGTHLLYGDYETVMSSSYIR